MSQGSSPRFLVDFWLTMGILKLNALVSGTIEEKGKDYRLTGNSNYLEKLVTSLKKGEPTCHLDISNIRKCQI